MKDFGVCTDDGFDDSEYTYEEVAVEEDFESEGDVESEDLEATLRSLQKLSFLLGNNINSIAVLLSLNFFLTILAPCKQVRVKALILILCISTPGKGQKKTEHPEVRRQREVLDDFVRNFCMTYSLHKTLETFEVRAYDVSFVLNSSLPLFTIKL
jgi:hypothetical protein